MTSTTYDGNLGGLTGPISADSKCQARATSALLTGTWQAWISNDTISAASRLPNSANPYLRLPPTGLNIADNWVDLTDASLDTSFSINEFGAGVTGPVWTGTNTNGSSYVGFNCSNWTSASSVVTGRTGNAISTIGAWTFSSDGACNITNRRLYCIETAP